MKDTLWKLFEETGNAGYYMLYKKLSEDTSQEPISDKMF